MMEYWKNGFRDTDVLGKWSTEGGTIKLKMDNILIKIRNPQSQIRNRYKSL